MSRIPQGKRGVTGLPDLKWALSQLHPKIGDVTYAASNALTRAGVPHVLIGGVAVGAHGYVRATNDVDFLVGDEAFQVHAGGLVTFAPGIPLSVSGVPVDSISLEPSEQFLRSVLVHRSLDGDVPLVPLEALVYLKLKVGRLRDRNDVIELMNRGMDVRTVRAFLASYAPELLGRFDQWYAEASR